MKILRLSVTMLLTAALVATGVLLSGVVQASHIFSDVPTSEFYHNAVEWVFNRGITAGCAVGLYCPNAAVTRGQMAVFLQKEGQALSPKFLTISDASGFANDFATNPVVCASTTDYTPTFPQVARVDSHVTFNNESATDFGFIIVNAYSTDGGSTWSSVTPALGQAASSRDTWASTSHTGTVDLVPGTHYRFATRSVSVFTSDKTAPYWCAVVVEISNRNPTTSPLTPQGGGH